MSTACAEGWRAQTPESPQTFCTKSASGALNLRSMRNPITASPNRPIPLPDCILRDGWWTEDERRPGLRVIAGAIQEGKIDRDHRRDDREILQLGQGR
jgi:hypothetical protein